MHKHPKMSLGTSFKSGYRLSPAPGQKTDKPENVLPVFKSLKNFRFLFRHHSV
jgi:hypothetical protein